MKLVTVAQMQALEQAAVEAGTSLDALMENAGRAVARETRREMGDPTGRRVLVLVGSGNNGGDGLVTARHLARWGASVTGYILRSRPDPDPKADLAATAGVRFVRSEDDAYYMALRRSARHAHVVIDAILGTGRARPIESPLADQLTAVREGLSEGHDIVLAVDLPTGMDADTGAMDPKGLPAEVILMLGHPKLGPYLNPLAEPLRAYRTLDIGLPPEAVTDSPAALLTREDIAPVLPARPVGSNKGTFGRCLIAAGSANFVGAAYLAAASAGRVGAGLVTLAAPASVYRLIASRLADATYIPLSEASPGVPNSGEAAGELLASVDRVSALLMGPGFGQSQEVKAFMDRVLLAEKELPPLVLDADCLNHLATVDRWWEKMSAPAVITPHPGEMARLMGTTVAEVQANRLSIALDAAKRFNAVVVLKGACTVVAAPEGVARISQFANSGLATAGTGDVLAGSIVGFMAQGLDPYAAAALGVYVHGAAGEHAREARGEAGMLASDLLDKLPDAILDLARSKPTFRTLDPSGR